MLIFAKIASVTGVWIEIDSWKEEDRNKEE